jgi:hypothetical protein
VLPPKATEGLPIKTGRFMLVLTTSHFLGAAFIAYLKRGSDTRRNRNKTHY